MSVRELVVLGTSARVPTQQRHPNGYLLRWDDEGILFDPGEGTQRQMIFCDITATSLTRIAISHFHGDHCLGLAGLCQRISLDRVPHPVKVYFPSSGSVYYERLRKASIYHSAASLDANPIDESSSDLQIIDETDNFQILAAPLFHSVPCLGYRLEEKARRTMLPEKLEALGIRGRAIGQMQRQGYAEVDGRQVSIDEVSVPKAGQSVAVIMDTRPCDNALSLSMGADVLLVASTYLAKHQKLAEKRQDMTAKEAGRLAAAAKAKKLILTHFDPMYENLSAHAEEAAKYFSNVELASEGYRYTIPRPPKA